MGLNDDFIKVNINTDKSRILSVLNGKKVGYMEEYRGYKLNYYPKCDRYPTHDNRYQTFKARPYDDADYYWAYSYDKENWIVVYKGKQKQQFVGTFEQVVDLIEEQNQNIKGRYIHG